ncbi:MAG: phosphatidate cytidylyltransferase [Bacteroidales bacterium]|nr:phosphatidate cytidylyltransferase [Bacteroidales bacterium]
MKELLQRTLTGLLLVALTVSAVYAGAYYTALLFWVVSNLGLLEWRKLVEKTGGRIPLWCLLAWGNILYLSVSAVSGGLAFCWLLTACVLCLSAMTVYTVFHSDKDGAQVLALTVAGGLYVALPLALLSLMPGLFVPVGVHGLMGFFLLVWAGDIFAYIVGSLFGKHKLCPSISPSKTWEGAMGGLVFSVAVGFLWWRWMMPDYSLPVWLGFSAVVAVCSIVGDLVESKLKRSAGVKDSGALLPGHGGMLDRFDGVLFAAPVAFAFEMLVLYFA